MSYEDRLQTLQYVSPDGDSFEAVLEYDADFTRSNTKKLAVTEFVLQNIARVQDLGVSNLNIPITCFIQGENYDQAADAFYEALFQKGAGVLTHPRWGTIDVMTLSVTQTEGTKDGAGVAQFDITFLEYFEEAAEFPQSSDDLLGSIESISTGLLDLSKSSLSLVKLSGVTQLSASYSRMKSRITSAVKNFGNIAGRFVASDANLYSLTQEKQSDINRNIDYYLENPSELLEALTDLFAAPASTTESLKQKVADYSEFTDDFIAQASVAASVFTESEGAIHYISVSAVASAAARAIENGTLTTRSDATAALESYITLESAVRNYYDTIEAKSGVTTDYEILKQTQAALTAAKAYLLQQSLNLPAEKVITLKREITPIELSFQEYGTIDRTDEIIDYNQLIGDEIFMIPRGRTVRLVA